MIKIRKIKTTDTSLMNDLMNAMDVFTEHEKEVAMELVETTINGLLTNKTPPDYYILVAEMERPGPSRDSQKDQSQIIGHICFGATPMTIGTFDLYWLTTHPSHRRKGVAKQLMEGMFEELRKEGARLLRTETAGQQSYKGTREFYLQIGLKEEARVKDFYTPGDDLVIYTYRF